MIPRCTLFFFLLFSLCIALFTFLGLCIVDFSRAIVDSGHVTKHSFYLYYSLLSAHSMASYKNLCLAESPASPASALITNLSPHA